MKIILGSSSRPRKQILEDNGFKFEIISPDIDEKAIRADDLYTLPLLLAHAKADALISKVKEPSVIITADQIVVWNNLLHEKPQSESEAIQFLHEYSTGQPLDVVSAVAVTNTQSGKRLSGVDVVKIEYRKIPENVINEYVKSGDPYSRAGGFAVTHPMLKPYVKSVCGTVDSVMGLPMHLLKEFIASLS